MLQDIEKGRKTEIDYLNGAVVKYGNKYNYRPIHNEILWKMIKTLETLNAIKEPNF
jgi:2-dehydropantoate 2-reductase